MKYILLLFTIMVGSQAEATGIVLTPNQEIDVYCRGVFKSTLEHLFTDMKQVTIQTSAGPMTAHVVERMKVVYHFKFANRALMTNLVNLGNGECGIINNMIQPTAAEQYIYTELKGNNTISFDRNSEFFNGPGEVRFSIQGVNASVFGSKPCSVYKVKMKMIGTGPSFNTILDASNVVQCAI